MAFRVDIEKKTLDNTYYRRVVYTDKKMQLVLMCLEKGEDIPMETHKHTTQFIRVESGSGIAIVGKTKYTLKDGVSIIIPEGKKHYIKNNGNNKMLLYTIYTPPEHSPDIKQKRQIIHK